MKEKKSVKQQVEELTPEQRSNIRKYELISGIISVVVIVPILIFFLNAFFKYKEIMNSGVSFLVKETAHKEYMSTLIAYGVFMLVYTVILGIVLAVVKKKMPYYSFGKAVYLLTHKVK